MFEIGGNSLVAQGAMFIGPNAGTLTTYAPDWSGILAYAQNSVGQLTVSAGDSILAHDTTATLGFIVGNNGAGVLNMLGGMLNLDNTQLRIGSGAAATGIVNLAFGGTISAGSVITSTGYGTLNFHGGTIIASTNATSAFMSIANAYIWPEGATIDSGTNAVTISTAMVAPINGGGLATIDSGSNIGHLAFNSHPVVKIGTNGGGWGAAAVANIDPTNGAFLGFTITNPGQGYTSSPTITLLGGYPIYDGAAYTGSASNLAPVVLDNANGTLSDNATNTTGVLTKNGPGTLTLSGNNTFTGGIFVNQGVLAVSGTVAASVVVGSGGTLSPIGGGVLSGSSVANSGLVLFNTTSLQQFTPAIVGSGGVQSIGSGTVQLLSTGNSYGGSTVINAGVFRAIDGVTLPSGSALILSGTTSGDAVFETSGNFTRALGNAAGQVSVGGTGNVGFSAYGGSAGIALNGGGLVTWGSGNFLPATNAALVLNESAANGRLVFSNDLSLGAGINRTITVNASGAYPAYMAGVISGGAGLIKGGPGTLVLTNANTYSGSTMVNSGILRLDPGAIIGGGTGAVAVQVNAGGTLIFNGGNVVGGTVALNGGGLTLGGTSAYNVTNTLSFLNSSANTITAGNNPNLVTLTGGGNMGTVKVGSGSVVFNGTGSIAVASYFNLNGEGIKMGGTGVSSVIVTNGGTLYFGNKLSLGQSTIPNAELTTLTLYPGGVVNGTNDINCLISVGDSTNGKAILNVAGGTAADRAGFAIGYANSAIGAVYQSAGTLTDAGGGGGVQVGGQTYGNAAGYYSLSGGVIDLSGGLIVGNYSKGLMDIRGTGTVHLQSGFVELAAYSADAVGVLNISGGTIDQAAGVGLSVGVRMNQQTGGTSIVNMSGGLLNIAAGKIEFNYGATGNAQGILNLNGGTVSASSFANTHASMTAVLNLNGGTIQSYGSTAQSNFIPASVSTFVWSNGAAISTTNMAGITIPANLLAPTGNGVVAPAGLSGLPTGLIAPPIVLVSGGGGSGAAAIANFDTNTGSVTGVTITSPGVNYTANPTFTFMGGGLGSNTLSLTGSLASNTNLTSGGLTKNGPGLLTLSGTNTYAGATIINQGTLILGGTSALVNSPVTVNANQGLQFGLAGTQTYTIAGLSGTGAVTLNNTTGTSAASLNIANIGGSYSYGGALSGSGGLSLSLGAAGAQFLSGTNNTFRGDVNINSGKLLISNNGQGWSTGSNNRVWVNGASAVLAGSGAVGSAVIVTNGGSVSPGDSGVGTLVINNNLTLGDNSTLLWHFGAATGAAGVSSDLIRVNGTAGTGGTVDLGSRNINLVGQDAGGFGIGVYKLIDYGHGTLNGSGNWHLSGFGSNYAETVVTTTSGEVDLSVQAAAYSLSMTLSPAAGTRVMFNQPVDVSGTVSNAGAVPVPLTMSASASNGTLSLSQGSLSVAAGANGSFSGSYTATNPASLGVQTLQVTGSSVGTSVAAVTTLTVVTNRAIAASPVSLSLFSEVTNATATASLSTSGSRDTTADLTIKAGATSGDGRMSASSLGAQTFNSGSSGGSLAVRQTAAMAPGLYSGSLSLNGTSQLSGELAGQALGPVSVNYTANVYSHGSPAMSDGGSSSSAASVSVGRNAPASALNVNVGRLTQGSTNTLRYTIGLSNNTTSINTAGIVAAASPASSSSALIASNAPSSQSIGGGQSTSFTLSLRADGAAGMVSLAQQIAFRDADGILGGGDLGTGTLNATGTIDPILEHVPLAGSDVNPLRTAVGTLHAAFDSSGGVLFSSVAVAGGSGAGIGSVTVDKSALPQGLSLKSPQIFLYGFSAGGGHAGTNGGMALARLEQDLTTYGYTWEDYSGAGNAGSGGVASQALLEHPSYDLAVDLTNPAAQGAEPAVVSFDLGKYVGSDGPLTLYNLAMVPEATSLSIVAAAGCVLLRRRRRGAVRGSELNRKAAKSQR